MDEPAETAGFPKSASVEVIARPYAGSARFTPGKELVGFKPIDASGRAWIEAKIDRHGAFWEHGVCWHPTHTPDGELDHRMLLHPWRDGVRAFAGELPYPSDVVDGRPISRRERVRYRPAEDR